MKDIVQKIRPGMGVVDAAGLHVGIVDSVDENRMRLSRSDSKDHLPHYLKMSCVAGIDDGCVKLAPDADIPMGVRD